MISVNGFPIGVVDHDDELMDYIHKNVDPSYLYTPWLNRSWPGPGLAQIAYPTGYRQLPPVRIGKFYWPRDASRWAYGHFLATSSQINNFAEAAWGSSGNQNNTVEVVQSSPGTLNGETMTTDLYIMPPYPVFANGDNNLYILTLVDVRYYWWNTPCPNLGITTTGAKTWQQVISALTSALNVAVDSQSSIDSAYLYPSIMLNLTGEPVPPILDAAAYNIGMRIARKFNGNLVIQSFATAYQSNYNDIQKNQNRTIRAGGWLFADL